MIPVSYVLFRNFLVLMALRISYIFRPRRYFLMTSYVSDRPELEVDNLSKIPAWNEGQVGQISTLHSERLRNDRGKPPAAGAAPALPIGGIKTHLHIVPCLYVATNTNDGISNSITLFKTLRPTLMPHYRPVMCHQCRRL